LDLLAGKCRNGVLPKVDTPAIQLHHAHLPSPGKALPNFVRNLHTDSKTAIRSRDKKLGYVPHAVLFSLHKNESSQLAVHRYEKRMVRRVAPVQRKRLVLKAAVCAEFQIVKFAEVVCIQLEQIRDDRLLLGRSREHLNSEAGGFGEFAHSVLSGR
jgi:hypothetical protein